MAAARQRIIELLPYVDEQIELEKQRDELTRKVAQYDELVKEGKRLVQQHAGFLQQQEVLQRQISEIEPLQPVAALLQERIETVAHLRAQLNERVSRQRLLNEKRELLRQKLEERETIATRLRKAESTIAKIEEHRIEAEELPTLQMQYEQFSEQRYRLEGNIEGYTKSRQQSAGGLCPLLHEPCLNIKQRGIISLESYFDGLVEGDRTRLAVIDQQQSTFAERINAVKKFAEALDKLGQYVEQRDNYVEYLQRLAIEIARLEREIASLMDELEALRLVDQQITREEAARKESQKADEQVRGLEGLRMQLQQLQEQARQCDALIQERRQQAKELGYSHEQLKQVGLELGKLNDPRGETKAQHDIIKQEPAYQHQLEQQQQELHAAEQQLHELEHHLAGYAELDVCISEQEAVLQQTHGGYKAYMLNEQTARLLPQREQAFYAIQVTVEQAQQDFERAEEEYLKAKAAYNQAELTSVDRDIKDKRGRFSAFLEKIQLTRKEMRDLEGDIQKAEAFLLELEAARKEKATLEELQQMMDLFRKLMKEAQMSGGEQMSAALSVRLALLKKLSSLNIAFFDEPTQSMDELRRMNLAEQIRRVRGFDQLIVISHDDTFEQGLDSLVRLRKVDGETRFMTEDHEGGEAMVRDREQVQANAS